MATTIPAQKEWALAAEINQPHPMIVWISDGAIRIDYMGGEHPAQTIIWDLPISVTKTRALIQPTE